MPQGRDRWHGRVGGGGGRYGENVVSGESTAGMMGWIEEGGRPAAHRISVGRHELCGLASVAASAAKASVDGPVRRVAGPER